MRTPVTPSPWWGAALTLAPLLALAQTRTDPEDAGLWMRRPWAEAYGWMWYFVIAAILVAIVALSARGWYLRRPRPR